MTTSLSKFGQKYAKNVQKIYANDVLRIACDMGLWSMDNEKADPHFERAASAFEADERPTVWSGHASQDV